MNENSSDRASTLSLRRSDLPSLRYPSRGLLRRILPLLSALLPTLRYSGLPLLLNPPHIRVVPFSCCFEDEKSPRTGAACNRSHSRSVRARTEKSCTKRNKNSVGRRDQKGCVLRRAFLSPFLLYLLQGFAGGHYLFLYQRHPLTAEGLELFAKPGGFC